MQFHPWLVGMRHAVELMLTGGLKAAFDEPDKPFGDYRTRPESE